MKPLKEALKYFKKRLAGNYKYPYICTTLNGNDNR
jgi:hypothetical protein